MIDMTISFVVLIISQKWETPRDGEPYSLSRSSLLREAEGKIFEVDELHLDEHQVRAVKKGSTKTYSTEI